MSPVDPIDLLFGGMTQLGPGDDATTLEVLRGLPPKTIDRVVDAGCGTGRQTLVLARELGRRIDAIDSHPPFLDALRRRAGEAGLADWVVTHAMDINDIPTHFAAIDLLWSEGAAYNIGFVNALSRWRPALAEGGLAVVSELCWLTGQRPAEAEAYFAGGYPAMTTVAQNVAAADAAGYRLLGTRTLSRAAWVDGYYDLLRPRAKELLSHPDPGVRDFAAEMLVEIEVFERSDDSYGYVFFALQRR